MIKNGLNIVWTGKELLQKIRERYSLLWFPGIQYNYGNTGIRRTLLETVTYFRLSGLCPPTYIHLRTIYGTNYNFASNGVGWVSGWRHVFWIPARCSPFPGQRAFDSKSSCFTIIVAGVSTCLPFRVPFAIYVHPLVDSENATAHWTQQAMSNQPSFSGAARKGCSCSVIRTEWIPSTY